ncbi:isochorismatase family protein [Paenalcaligenes niemegkensis]|uniref:isochorismatase family protein n=1 Tax=Paenalcaligenes niemegkensis TaxID=2895469 RepID=UPI001EE95298|nr:isochorismatase family protein [Paenalcaligenes niemegkensis]MCQ9617649.1 isochorismatase family protein [Paenalcaligenes niemegkensis]
MSDVEVYGRQGFGHTLSPEGHIALIIVDFVNGFADPAAFGGGNITQAIANTQHALADARIQGWKVAHSRIVFAENGSDKNIFGLKVPPLTKLHEHEPTSAVVDQLRPIEGELVVRKTAPSAFFNTGLAPWLSQYAVQTVLIAGATTSGCVRATAVDAMSYGFRPFVLEDCVGDRASGPHDASLFDIRQKYGEVMPYSALRTLLVS